MKKFLALSAIVVLATSVSAYALDDVASERFHQKSGNFGGSAYTANVKNASTNPRSRYVYNRNNSAPYSRTSPTGNVKTATSKNAFMHTGSTNPYTTNNQN